MINEYEEGIITEIHNKTATVKVKSSSLCSHCKACILGDNGYIITEAENPISAKVGDKVSLRINSKRFLGSFMLVFGLPLFALFIGVTIANTISKNQIFGLFIGLVLFFLSFIPIKIYDKHLRKTNACNITIVEVIEEKF
ncbi:MAG: SoxR reducing system RseC family protein [Candidatus Poribacteria bacterium]